MRRIIVAAMSTLSGLALLFGYHTSTNRAAGNEVAISQSQSTSGAVADPPTATEDGGGTETGSTGTLSTGTFTGSSVATRWGDVQVQISVKAGRITSSEAIVYPNANHRDIEINNYALPILNKEVLEAQTAEIDFVSGATVTSEGYTQSLQSAIDEAFK